MQAGALDYVVKPFKVSGILLILARALETRQLRIANARLELLLRQHTDELDAMNKDLQLAREVAERANQEKTNFLSSMSHELRTPLNAILGFSQMLMSDSIPSTAQEKKIFASHIFGAGRHLLTLINDILDIAKIESGNMSLSMEPVDLAGIYHECWQMMEPLARKRGITLTSWKRSACMCWPTVRASSRYCSTCCRTPSSTTGNRAKSTSIASPSIRSSCACPCATRAAG